MSREGALTCGSAAAPAGGGRTSDTSRIPRGGTHAAPELAGGAHALCVHRSENTAPVLIGQEPLLPQTSPQLERWYTAARTVPTAKPAPRPAASRSHKPPRQADLVYAYDGSFEGFLCCIFESIRARELPFAVWPPDRQTATLFPTQTIETDPDHAARVFASFDKRLGPATRRLLMNCFLSGEPEKELLILRFLHMAYAVGPAAAQMLGHPDVAPLYKMQSHLATEVDKLQGFLRFEESEGMLGAVIHPRDYVLPLLRAHFCARLPEERFLIYDATHQAALLYQDHTATLTDLEAPLHLPPPDDKERYYQQLWKQFYHTLSIAERYNPACRRTHCPKRYWADMTELREEL